MQAGAHIVVVDDDPVTRLKLAGYFGREGYAVTEAASAEELREVIARKPADLVLLDINLPGEDGLKLTRDLRAGSSIGIILVTGRTDDVDRIIGLEMGADDYVTKPFNVRELLARAKNLIRRVQETGRIATARRPVRTFAGWRFDVTARTLQAADGGFVDLTRAEYRLLDLFTANPGKVLSRDWILREVAHRDWSPHDRTADVVVRRLRVKLGDDPKNPRLIVTSHGEGYLFAGLS